MAIYHFTAKIVSRQKGQSAVASAAYRAAENLYDERVGQTFDYTRKEGVAHTEILAPEDAPAWVYTRERLWNTVETCETRKDSQLARELEIALPRELNSEAQIALLRDFAQRECVQKGMIADCSLHLDNPENPHAHILLTLRSIHPYGFGLKERSWNQRSNLHAWRLGWAEVANEHLAQAGLATRIDHRTLEAQEIDLIPGRKIGVGRERQHSTRLPTRIADRVAEQHHIATLNGAKILANPSIALRALTHQQLTFTKTDIARFLNTRTHGAEQFRAAYLKVTTSPELMAAAHDDPAQQRYVLRQPPELKATMLHRPVPPDPANPTPHKPQITMDLLEAAQQKAAERWQEKQRASEQNRADLEQHLSAEIDDPAHSPDPNTPDLSRDGLEDDFDL